MRLRAIIAENTRTDFFDVYLLAASPDAVETPEGKALWIDRVDRLFETMRREIYWLLLQRAENCGIALDYQRLAMLADPAAMWKIISTIAERDRADSEADQHFQAAHPYEQHKDLWRARQWSGGAFVGSWERFVRLFGAFCQAPQTVTGKFALLDSFFGLSHNNGPITDHLHNLPWLLDALYLRALAAPAELAKHASPDVKEVTTSGNRGLGYQPVTDDQRRALYHAKLVRGQNARPAGNPPSWMR